MSFRREMIESDFYDHGEPIRLSGGGVIKWVFDNNEIGLLDISVPSLSIMQPFRIYKLAVRRHIPFEVLGKQLKFRAIECGGTNPNTYTGYHTELFDNKGRERDQGTDYGHDFDVDGWDGDEGFTMDGKKCGPRVVHTETHAQIYPVRMEGFANSAMVDDIVRPCTVNEPLPYILFYINDAMEVILLNRCRPRKRSCRPCAPEVVFKNTLVTNMPYVGKTQEIQTSAFAMTRPNIQRSGQLFVEGGVGSGRGSNHVIW